MTKASDVFVWTKIGDDAGERIGGILFRKEAERLAGSFWWGIGSSLDRNKLKRAIDAASGDLQVIFSAQLSPPKRCDFGGMTLWTRWLDDSGGAKIPDHAMVISKGRSTRYYCLVCRSDESILSLGHQPFDEKLFCNYPNGKQPGGSQNTAILTGNLKANHGRGRYKRTFLASLVRFVSLAAPRLLSSFEQDLIANWNGKDYASLVRRIRRPSKG